MELIAKLPKGTKDILPGESYKWQIVEDVIKRVSASYGYNEIRTPVFEQTNLFMRSMGEKTDVVEKQMYTFNDKGGRSLTLRPEGTAPVARAVIEHGIFNETLPIKTYYFSSCYRYERPQAFRYREFNQFGIECFGAKHPAADAEIICLANSIFECLGLSKLSLQINSIGCKECRKEYYKALKEYFNNFEDDICPLCTERLDRAPMRVLDCKNEKCIEISKGAPSILDYLCDECSSHFNYVKAYLDARKINYKVNKSIVRGLDYYSKTVFEFIYSSENDNITICGGGRYDGLTKQMGGPDMPSLGFGIGLERLINVLDEHENIFKDINPQSCDLYIANIGNAAHKKAFELCEEVRTSSLNAQCDLSGRGLKAQMKYADKIGAKFIIVLGEDEIKKGNAKLKNMKSSKEENISIDKNFFDEFIKIYNEETHKL
jgi:histidyl-tRNA synthetase